MSDESTSIEYPIVVLATSKEAGEAYCKVLGLSNYRVVTNQAHTQGIRMRAMVISPGFLSELEGEKWLLPKQKAINSLIQSAVNSREIYLG